VEVVVAPVVVVGVVAVEKDVALNEGESASSFA
jgi:hypothetical protein